jgi:CarboxypepD_reg-like domain
LSNNKNDKKNYTSADIRRYLNGSMNAAEMYAIEKAALEDVFLADALEGYSLITNKTAEADIAFLQQQFKHEEADKNPGWWRAAAAIFLLAGIGIIGYQLQRPNAKNEIAKTENIEQVPVTTNTEKKIAPPVNNTPPQQDSTALPPIKAKNKITPKATDKKNLPKAKTDIPPAALPAPAIQPFTKAEENAVRAQVKKEAVKDVAMQRKENPAAVQLEGKTAGVKISNQFSGQVFDDKQQPIQGATVATRNNKLATVTDANGKFFLNVPDSVARISVNAVGYQPLNQVLKNDVAENKIILQPGKNNLSEVVVVSNSAKTKNAKTNNRPNIISLDSVQSIFPEDGWDNYNTYLQNNAGKLSGDVDVIFELDKKGKPEHINITNKTNAFVANKAVKLLQQGPRWQQTDSTMQKKRVKLRFRK